MATQVYVISCPDCPELIELPAGAQAGDTYQCCGRDYILTFEYGSYALERLGS